MIEFLFSCSGCDAKETVTPEQPHFLSISGRSWGLGNVQYPKVTDIVPEGWTAADPYTHLVYCKKCFAEIMDGKDEPAPDV